jgi:hypothetical protein
MAPPTWLSFRRDRALVLGYAVQTVAVGAVAAALYWEAPIALVYGLAAVVAASVTVTRPVQSALFPQLARSTDELVAENVVAATISSAMGAAVTPLLVAALGVRGRILAAGLLLPIAVILLTARIRPVDRGVELLEQEVTLLQSMDLFAPLTSHTLEGIATRLTRVAATPGVVLMREGDPGDRFYIVADGELELSREVERWQSWARGATSERSRF